MHRAKLAPGESQASVAYFPPGDSTGDGTKSGRTSSQCLISHQTHQGLIPQDGTQAAAASRSRMHRGRMQGARGAQRGKRAAQNGAERSRAGPGGGSATLGRRGVCQPRDRRCQNSKGQDALAPAPRAGRAREREAATAFSQHTPCCRCGPIFERSADFATDYFIGPIGRKRYSWQFVHIHVDCWSKERRGGGADEFVDSSSRLID